MRGAQWVFVKWMDRRQGHKIQTSATLNPPEPANAKSPTNCLMLEVISFASFNWKAWNPAAYHGIGEEEDGIQGPEEKSGFLCTGKQTAAAPELRGHNGNTSTPLLPASVPYFSRPLKRDLLFPLNFSTDGARAVVDETLCLGRDQGCYTKQHC